MAQNELTGWVEVYPAYGADYTSQKAVQAAWDAGADFRTYQGPYINKADAAKFAPNAKFLVRYANQRKVVSVK